MNPETERQQVLFLWLDDSSLLGSVIGWAFHDGNDPAADQGEAPYDRGVDALTDGWRLMQVSALTPPPVGGEHRASFLKHEFLFEKIVPRRRD